MDDSHLRRIIVKMVAQAGRRVDESTPMVDARLADGSRLNAVLPRCPCAVHSSPSASSRSDVWAPTISWPWELSPGRRSIFSTAA